MLDHTDSLTVVIERLKTGELRRELIELREELLVDGTAMTFLCEFSPVKAERLFFALVDELADAR